MHKHVKIVFFNVFFPGVGTTLDKANYCTKIEVSGPELEYLIKKK